jgi:hypothetical protein
MFPIYFIIFGNAWKSHFRDSRFQNFPGDASHRIPLDDLMPLAFASPPSQKKNEGLATPLWFWNTLDLQHTQYLIIMCLFWFIQKYGP